jgi:hypothetical protein
MHASMLETTGGWWIEPCACTAESLAPRWLKRALLCLPGDLNWVPHLLLAVAELEALDGPHGHNTPQQLGRFLPAVCPAVSPA